LTRTALVVGAGIAGLSAGIALRQAGWNIHIFERAASPRELGFGVGLAPNAIAALRELGVADVVLARSFEPRRILSRATSAKSFSG
jgi:2-polyprenyl-6-methoxyphenol hydroxylase-like FAD-dependent oxidoreductase